MAARFELDAIEFERLAQAIKSFPNDAEAAINEVFHGEGSDLLQEAIYRLMPVSGKHWSGKKPAAKTAKSLTSVKSNLAVTVTTTKKYQYLYFPDDGTSTTRHVGNQQFFRRGGEEKQAEIIDRCIGRLVSGFEK